MDRAGLKQKVIHESGEFLTVFLFLAPLFGAFSTYRMLLLNQFREASFQYGTAFINALILSKIILIGEYLRLGKRHENRPLIYSTVYKSFVFTLLVAVFHILENAVKGFLHGEGVAGALAVLNGKGRDELLARSLVIFCAFLPFFALRETRRVLGEHKLADLFFRPRASAGYDPPAPRRFGIIQGKRR
jgi:hypothetical protein